MYVCVCAENEVMQSAAFHLYSRTFGVKCIFISLPFGVLSNLNQTEKTDRTKKLDSLTEKKAPAIFQCSQITKLIIYHFISIFFHP